MSSPRIEGSGAGAADAGIERGLATLRGLLTADETLEAWAAQHRLFALTHRRVLLAATSGRFIALTRHLLGGYESQDIRWQDLRETRIRAGILAADLTLVAQASADLNLGSEINRVWAFAGLRKDQAQAIYRICQQHDQVWREKRRVRELEELRARSGGLQFGAVPYGAAGAAGSAAPEAAGSAAPGAAGGQPAEGESEAARRIRQAREMLDAKLISDAEFESIKAKIIAGL
ncbi:MAG TPA: hypothetical protein VME42_21180 [Steroidobacteraceae bacterium]|nr:hypothetical protein [Steroidobacteraceae bacterium]